MIVLAFADLDTAAGADLGTSRWFEIDQARVDAFAESTEDRQWIHTDPARAADGPFGTTIAHGFLTLSLASARLEDLLRVPDTPMAVNYGLDRIRFTAPVPVGSRVCGHGLLASVHNVAGGKQLSVQVQVIADAAARPACIAQWLVRFAAPELA